MKSIALGVAALTLAGCATVVDGTQQTISLSSNAEGAICGITQNGRQIVAPAPVPASHVLPRVQGNLIVTCEAAGYETAQLALVAGKNPKTVALALPLALVNAGADTALGGIDWYQDRAYVYLKKTRMAVAGN